MKKVLSIFMCMVMLTCIVASVAVHFSAKDTDITDTAADVNIANTGVSQDEAVAWVRSRAGKSLDYDGRYGAQCVDLILYYYNYLVGYTVSGNATDYQWNSLPDGWYRTSTPTPGDIVVWAPGAYEGKPEHYADPTNGHIGIVVNVYNGYIDYYDQNSWAYGQTVGLHEGHEAQYAATYIHPNLSYTPVNPTAPEVQISQRGIYTDIHWNNVGASSYYLYIQRKDTGDTVYSASQGQALSTYLELAEGSWKAVLTAVYSDTVMKTTIAEFNVAFTAPEVQISQRGIYTDIHWNSVGAASYYLYIQRKDTGDTVYSADQGQVFSTYLELAEGQWKAVLTAVYSDSKMKTTIVDFEVAFDAPEVQVSQRGKYVDIKWNDVGATSYYLYVKNRDTGDTPYSADQGKALSTYLELAKGSWKAALTAVYSDSKTKTTIVDFDIDFVAPEVQVNIEGQSVDIMWSDVGATSYYVYVKNVETGKTSLSKNLGNTLSYHLDLSDGTWQVFVNAVFSENSMAANACDFTVGVAPTEPPTETPTTGSTEPPRKFILGDVDGDSLVTVTDATLIQRHRAGYDIGFPIGEPIE